MNDKLLTTTEAANYLGISKAFLERDRWQGARIPFVQVGSKAVRYRQQDLENYIESQTRTMTQSARVS